MSAETDLSNSIVAYAEGLTTGVGQAKATGQLSPITANALAGASTLVPGAAQAAAIAGAVVKTIGSVTGPGSTLARVVTASLTSNNIFAAPINIAKAIINGRTYESGDYKLAVLYLFYVKGQNVTSPNYASDNDVLESVKWFVLKLGIYIQGNLTIESLRTSAATYIALRSVNNYITTDPVRVGAAAQVVQLYMVMNGVAGSWAQTVGVFDQALVELANNQYAPPVIGAPGSTLGVQTMGTWLSTYKVPLLIALGSIVGTVLIVKLADR